MPEEEKRIEREKHVERIAGIINKGAEQILEDQVRETRRKHEHHEIKYGYVHPERAEFERQQQIKKDVALADKKIEVALLYKQWEDRMKREFEDDVSRNVFEKAVEKFGLEQVFKSYQVDNNIFATEMRLSGFTDFMEFLDYKANERKNFEKMLKDETKKHKDDLLWEAQMDFFRKGK